MENSLKYLMVTLFVTAYVMAVVFFRILQNERNSLGSAGWLCCVVLMTIMVLAGIKEKK